MTRLHPAADKPRIVVCDADYGRLFDLLAGVQNHPAGGIPERLQRELERASVVATGDLPENVVRMGSTAEFRSDAGQEKRVQLVFPAEADISANRVSILTPIGVALIGLSEGQSIAFMANNGQSHALTVIRVAPPSPQQPVA